MSVHDGRDDAHVDGPDITGDPREFWENHYGGQTRVWSGRVNARLADVAAELTPGWALDLGSGEGADALWLAQQGWQVVAVDISSNALTRGAADAQARGLQERIDFEQHDLSETFPEGSFDLVSAQFLHTPLRLDRERALKRAASAVREGGLLLIVDHGAAPPWAWKMGHDHPFPSPDEVLTALALDAAQWERVRVERADRDAIGPDGQEATVTDNVIAMRRISTGHAACRPSVPHRPARTSDGSSRSSRNCLRFSPPA